MLIATFPDFRMTPEDVIASGDKAVARLRVTGTQKGPFMGVPATGKQVEVKLVDIIRFGDDGRAREHWGVVDLLAMLQQLGAIPAGPPA
jgi:predicted ester cyclase